MKFFLLIFSVMFIAQGNCDVDPRSRIELKRQYFRSSSQGSDINEHIPVLCELAKSCSHVIEIGLREIVSTWGILEGLAQNSTGIRSYIGIDLVRPPEDRLQLAQNLAAANEISFEFWQGNDMDIDIEPAEMLFIDTLHTYCHLTYELEKFSPKISKYIAMHDTSAPWGNADENIYHGDYSEYPAWYDRTKRGLWPAVVDFLDRHPEWKLQERRLNNHGLTILRRVGV